MNKVQEVKIPIYVLDTEAKQFLIFQQYFRPFSLLVDNGVFSIKGGRAEIHFSKLGEIIGIDKHFHTTFNP